MSNWQITTLEEMTPRNTKYGIVDGPFGSNLKTIHYKTSGIPIITSGFVTEGVFHADNYLYVTKEKYEAEKRSSVSGNDIVMAKIGARCGASAILPSDHQTGILSGNALKITIDESRFSTKLVWQILWMLYRNGSLDKLKTVGAQPAISMNSLKKLKLRLPDIHEQKRIAAILAVWNDYLEILDTKIILKRNIKQGLMQDLLSGKRRFEGFSEPWKVLPLSSVCKINPNSNKLPEKFLYIDLGSVQDGSLGQHLKYIKREDAPSRAQRVLQDNDVLFQTVRPYQKNNFFFNLGDGYVASTGYAALRANESSRYLYHFLQSNSFIKEVLRMCTGSNYPAITSSDLGKIKVNFPSFDEQNRIEEVLTAADNEIRALEASRKLLQNQREYLINNMVSGQISTQNNENATLEGAGYA
jgi:type I restriction enzyme S subunit